MVIINSEALKLVVTKIINFTLIDIRMIVFFVKGDTVSLNQNSRENNDTNKKQNKKGEKTRIKVNEII